MTLNELVQYPNGFFRRERAEKYPGDYRNRLAAEIFDKIEAELPSYEGSKLHSRVESLSNEYGEDRGIEYSEIVSRAHLDVGFRSDVKDAKTFLEGVIERLEAAKPKRKRIKA